MTSSKTITVTSSRLLSGTVFLYSQPGRLQKFISDLKSGKLHREFHHGPDPVRLTLRVLRKVWYPTYRLVCVGRTESSNGASSEGGGKER